jgi:hypothetical protein
MQMSSDVKPHPFEPLVRIYDCRRCGRFELTSDAERYATVTLARPPQWRSVTSHVIRKMQRDAAIPRISHFMIEKIWSEGKLPSPAQQANTLIQLVGDKGGAPGKFEGFTAPELSGILGTGDDGKTNSTDCLTFVIKYLQENRLIDTGPGHRPDALGFRLTFDGWRRFDELRHTSVDSTTAFMAMKFGRAVTDKLFLEFLKPAVAEAGFDLRRLDESPKPGLIDQRMEVELRTAKFIVADLTHGNRGAYWEAGFASGLGKPVFYICEAARFRRVGTHFDTNHHFTIMWDSANMAKVAEDLKTAIRFNLPGDSKLTNN